MRIRLGKRQVAALIGNLKKINEVARMLAGTEITKV